MSERKELAAWLRDWASHSYNEVVEEKFLRAADLLDPPAQGRTVRVRLCVAVNADGEWDCYGYGNSDGPFMDSDDHPWSDRAAESIGTGCRGVWIEADVPLPEETTVEGEVQP